MFSATTRRFPDHGVSTGSIDSSAYFSKNKFSDKKLTIPVSGFTTQTIINNSRELRGFR